jgi:hypothetical protein
MKPIIPTNQWLTLNSNYPPPEIKVRGVKVDILGKAWDPKTDRFVFTRLVDCEWDWGRKEFATESGRTISEFCMRPAYFMLIEFPSTVD